jgi:SAM-dependent methyltransferase
MTLICRVCGCTDFSNNKVLWDALIAEWELSPDETAYIDRQQGTLCNSCHGSLRINALAGAISGHIGSSRPLREIVKNRRCRHLKVLDLNGASSVSNALSGLRGYKRADYPEVDMQDMPFQDNQFDLVVHSDTLEHVPNPIKALAECLRVINPNGSVCFTIPIIVGRISKSREGLPKSYHGNPDTSCDDLSVKTEFGADFWIYALKAGAASVSITSAEYPSAQAIRLTKTQQSKPLYSKLITSWFK